MSTQAAVSGSVHNDYQRHLLYIWAFPEFETQKMEGWGSWAQDPEDGHVFECLAGFGHGPLDRPTGRYMGDTTSIFVLEVYEYYMHTGNKTWVHSMWPGEHCRCFGLVGSISVVVYRRQSCRLVVCTR